MFPFDQCHNFAFRIVIVLQLILTCKVRSDPQAHGHEEPKSIIQKREEEGEGAKTGI
jgi:hypothetical protein